MSTKPTDEDLEITRNTIEFLEENTRNFEPYATNFIEACEEILLAFPDSSDEIPGG